jgi:MtfA peptidase
VLASVLATLLVFVCVALLILGILGYPSWIEQRRNHLRERPFPELWAATVEHSLPMYTRLASAERNRLQGHIQVFLAEKQFIGCNGLQVTDQMKVIIAATACLLLLNERKKYFPKLRSLLIYPSAYWVNETVSTGYVVEERRVARLGESWSRDRVVLSWDRIEQDTLNWQDGHNVVLHEFAHQLDQEDGTAEGVPILPNDADYSVWAAVMQAEYRQLCQAVAAGTKTVMDSYGATNPAEFFAVATETFFEKPQQLLQKHPNLYQQLQTFYKLEPIQWL